jgi:hypothetical protein
MRGRTGASRTPTPEALRLARRFLWQLDDDLPLALRALKLAADLPFEEVEG